MTPLLTFNMEKNYIETPNNNVLISYLFRIVDLTYISGKILQQQTKNNNLEVCFATMIYVY